MNRRAWKLVFKYLANHGSLGSQSSGLDALVCSFATKANEELVSMYCLSSFGQPRCLAKKGKVRIEIMI